jgi:predicted AAA+ superfamily ATPase
MKFSSIIKVMDLQRTLTHKLKKLFTQLSLPVPVCDEVPAYSGNSIKRISGKPKGYIGDTGITCHSLMMNSSGTIGNHPQSGTIFETFIAAEIRKMISLDSVKADMYHWRTHGGAKVDMVLERDGILYPIEIKLTSSPSRRDTTGISAFRGTYKNMKIAPGLVIAPVEKIMRISENDYAMAYDCAG